MQYIRQFDEGDIVQTLNLALFGDPVEDELRDFLVMFADLNDPRALRQYGNALVASDEYEESFASTSSEAFVRSIYYNLFDRAPTLGELQLYVTALDDRGAKELNVVNAILARAEDRDVEAYQAKLAIADWTTAQEATGGFVPDSLTREGFRSNAEVYFDLIRLDAASDDLSLEVIGQSLNGNPLYSATVGTGDINLLYVTQLHGDEPTATEGAFTFLEFMTSDDPEAALIRENVTVTLVPRVNPDGFARWERELGGEIGLIDPRRNEENIDLNRTFDPEDPADPETAPESYAVQQLAAELDPALVLDFHNQNLYRAEDGSIDTMSVLWATNPDVAPEVTDEGKRAAVAIDDALEGYEFSNLTLFPGSDTTSLARNGLALEGTPTLLIEQRFLEEMFELSRGLEEDFSAVTSALSLEAFLAMKGVALSYADGSFELIDPAEADTIPERSDAIDYADLYSDDNYTPEDAVFV